MPRSLLPKNTTAILAEAVSAELYASHRYRYLSNHMQRLGYFGAAAFFRTESAAELEHYQRHADYMNDRGGVAPVPDLPEITDPVKSLRDALEIAYEMEIDLGEQYGGWWLRLKESDPATTQHLLQFIEIQTKSVGEYGDWLARLDRAGEDECGILLIDQELKPA